MSLFLHKENQNILWNLLHKSPYFAEFQQKYPDQKYDFFSNAIAAIDRQIRFNPTNVEQLLEMNKEALTQIVSKLKQILGYSSVWTQHDIQQEKVKREEANTNKYNSYEEQYHELLQAPKAPNLDLNLGIKDDKISGNMEELLKRHTELRERDVYIPPPSIQLQKEMGVSIHGSIASNVPRELQTVSSKNSPYDLPDILKPVSTKIPAVFNGGNSQTQTQTQTQKLKITEEEEPLVADSVEEGDEASPDVVDIRQELIGREYQPVQGGISSDIYKSYNEPGDKIHMANGVGPAVAKQVRWTE